MVQEHIMEAFNEKFKAFFKEHRFKVRRDYSGMKATKEDAALTFYIGYDCFNKSYREQEQVDSMLYVKLPYTNYTVAKYYFMSTTTNAEPNLEVLDKVFTDPDFLALFDWALPEIFKKIV